MQCAAVIYKLYTPTTEPDLLELSGKLLQQWGGGNHCKNEFFLFEQCVKAI